MNVMFSRNTVSQTLPKVRRALPIDLPQILEIGKELWAENGLLPISEQCIHDTAVSGICGRGSVIGVIGGPRHRGYDSAVNIRVLVFGS